MALIPDETIEQILDRTDIVALASRYMTLKRSGPNNMGCCPFHNEKTPSFNVNSVRQRYHCFGCGVDGHAINLLMQFEGLGFRDACKKLASEAGITIEERPVSPQEEERRKARERLFRVNEITAEYFHQLLLEHPQGRAAREYMARRGYKRRSAQEYQIGFALDRWDGLRNHLEAEGCSAEDARALGLIREGKQGRGDYDLFRGRLMFPIFDQSGRVVAFGGRVLDDSKPKYINSPESPVYHKGRVLFGLYQAREAMRRSKEAIVVEGYFDQLALYRAGYPQALATCGTALTSEHARLLKRYADRVVLLFDQDDAGKQATFKAMSALQSESIPALVVNLPGGDDPDSFLQQQGRDAFAQLLAEARPAMEAFIDECLTEAETVEQKAAAAEQVLERIHALNSSLERDLYLKQLAERSGIDLAVLKEMKPKAKYREAAQQLTTSLPEPTPMYEPAGMPDYEPDPSAYAAYSDAPPPDEGVYPALVPDGHEAVPTQRNAADWSRHIETLLRLLSCSQVAREQFRKRGGVALIDHAGAEQLAQLMLEQLNSDEDDIASLEVDFEPSLMLAWQKLVQIDKDAYCENIEQMVGDCLWQEQKQVMTARLNELRRTLIPAAETDDDRALARQLNDEMIDLLTRIKNRIG